MKTALAGIGIVFCMWASFAVGEEPDSQDSIVVTLSIPAEEVSAGEQILLRMRVENQGESAVKLIRPRGNFITAIEELGWSVFINGPQGKYGLFPAPRSVYPVQDAHIMELAPGEFVGASVRVGYYCLLSKHERPFQIVGKTPGTYQAVITYHARKDGFFLLEKEKVEDLFLGPVSSSKVEFEVVKQQEQPNPVNVPDQK